MRKILPFILFFLFLGNLFSQDNCSTKTEYYNCQYYSNDLYVSELLSMDNPSQQVADALLKIYGTIRCDSRIVTMTLEEKEDCKEVIEWNQRVDIEAAKDMLINRETYETEYHKNTGRRMEDKRYDSFGEYIGRYHYQYFGDPFGTERDSKDKNGNRTGRVLWWYPSGYLESETFFKNDKLMSKKCFADNSSNDEISCP